MLARVNLRKNTKMVVWKVILRERIGLGTCNHPGALDCGVKKKFKSFKWVIKYFNSLQLACHRKS